MNSELFDRAKRALTHLGIATESEWANTLRAFLSYDTAIPCSLMESEVDEILKKVAHICDVTERQEFERQHQAATSQWIGQIGKRIELTARVQFTKSFPPKEEGLEESRLTVLVTDEGNVVKYWNRINLQNPTVDDPDGKRPAVKDERVKVRATVIKHDTYKSVKQTQIQRVLKAVLA